MSAVFRAVVSMVASLTLLMLGAGAGRAAAPQMSPPTAGARPARPIYPRSKRAAGATVRYTLVDDGTPASTTYALEGAVAFNNAGQIAGNAYLLNPLVSSQPELTGGPCVFFDGKKYRDLTPSANVASCVVSSINNENPTTGAVDIVAFGTTLESAPQAGTYGDFKSIYSTIYPGSGAIRTTIYPNDQSFLSGVNDSGTAIGAGDYAPLTGFAAPRAPMLAMAGASALAVLQPGCTTVHLGCAGFQYYEGGVPVSCGFGACLITSDGTVFLPDVDTGAYETIAPNGTTQDIDLAADVVTNPIYEFGYPIINNAKQLLYTVQTIVSGVTIFRPQVYQIGVGPILTVPPIAGSTCTQYIPLSFNNAGDVFGRTEQCGTSADYTYFLYDPATGTHDLSSEIPASGYVSLTPCAVNDNGQILVYFLSVSGGPTHWGLLDPTASTKAERRAYRLSARARAHRKPTATTGPQSAAAVRIIAKADIEARAPRPDGRRTNALHAPVAGPRPHPLPLRRSLASTPSYTIVDYGAPTAQGYALQNPVAFNNTGQIVGTATDVPYGNNSTCILFDGARFRNISSSSTIVDCAPYGINDRNQATGAVEVVGTVTSAFSFDPPCCVPGGAADAKAFTSKITPQRNLIGTTVFGAYDESVFLGVNAAGAVVGQGIYLPSVNPYLIGLFTIAPGSNAVAIAKPTCTAFENCGYLNSQPCAFGGCEILADGSIFLSNELLLPDGSTQPVPLGDAYEPIANNAKQVLFRASSSDVARAAVVYDSNVRLYQIGTGAVTIIPKISNDSCGDYVPLSFNNSGSVLGYTSFCSKASDETYFTFDPVDGTRNLLAELPSGAASVSPIGINDSGQILVGIKTNGSPLHWGILQPTTPAHARAPYARGGPRH